ncbi:phage terminase small subunit P27 family [Dyadobacter chenwenxiniae]|uniref:Phage terminase small subunit P27 family n=1 Tax=Dyadobacter chenwenxiniae TaxID=2906456 RepID=A0A9X1TDB7_9BACT|nr:phage terminase small subunit P27 family [Dyadobacter chenwenxiniae]MCF0060130.1 phage terminase small subunit P27 family [Dyadobacter chenwenxiniae]UON85868.1 phage terminase small subunit P27 family [Dyadobacter chenwenxiniae]
MPAGRKPKSTELLQAQGTYRKDRHKDRVKIVDELKKSPVDWLTDEEKEVWSKWYDYLQKNDVLKETDEVAFGLLCKTFVRVQKFGAELITTDDYISEHKSDVGAMVTKKDPKYEIMADSEKSLLRLLTEFGMTPASRAKVKAAVQAKKNPLQELRNRGKEQ